MGHESFVYGIINLNFSYHEPDKYLLLAEQEIAKLPQSREDDEWPFLNQQHFARAGGYYKSRVITIGGSYKQVECEWEQWLAKFERLLASLCWCECYLHLRTEISGEFDFQYIGQSIYVGKPGEGEWHPPQRWKFSGGPRCNSCDDSWFEDFQKEQVWIFENGKWRIEA